MKIPPPWHVILFIPLESDAGYSVNTLRIPERTENELELRKRLELFLHYD